MHLFGCPFLFVGLSTQATAAAHTHTHHTTPHQPKS